METPQGALKIHFQTIQTYFRNNQKYFEIVRVGNVEIVTALASAWC
jgi:hypothetical protein